MELQLAASKLFLKIGTFQFQCQRRAFFVLNSIPIEKYLTPCKPIGPLNPANYEPLLRYRPKIFNPAMA